MRDVSMFGRRHTYSKTISPSAKRVGGISSIAPGEGRTTHASIPKPWHAISIDAKPLSCVWHRTGEKSDSCLQRRLRYRWRVAQRVLAARTYKHHEYRRSKARRKDGAGMSSNAARPRWRAPPKNVQIDLPTQPLKRKYCGRSGAETELCLFRLERSRDR